MPIFTDPRAGTGYSFGAPIPSVDISAVMTALRNIEDRARFKTWSYAPVVGGVVPTTNWMFATGALASNNTWIIAASGNSSGTTNTFILRSQGGVFLPYKANAASFTPAASSAGMAPSIATSGSTAVIVGDSGNTTQGALVSTSGFSPGATWTITTTGTGTGAMQAVAWCPVNSLFVACKQGIVITSANGTSWSTASLPGGLSGVNFAYIAEGADGRIIVSPNGGSAIATFSGGSWSTYDPGVGTTGLHYCAARSAWYGCNSTTLYRSVNGTTWSSVGGSLPGAGILKSIGKSLILLRPETGDNPDDNILSYSSDEGTTWTTAWANTSPNNIPGQATFGVSAEQVLVCQIDSVATVATGVEICRSLAL